MRIFFISTVRVLLLTYLSYLPYPTNSFALGPPARIYGSISINGTILTQDNDTGYSVSVSRADGSPYSPVPMDNDGLTETLYIIDLNLDSSGPKENDTAVIHVYRNGKELTINSPVNGEFTIDEMGSLTRIDIQANASLKGFRKSFIGGIRTTKKQKVRVGGSYLK
jgi:hypothetical protein